MDLAQIKTATVIRPGDHVLLTATDPGLSAEDLDGMVAALTDRFPGVEFTIAMGVSDIAVRPRNEDT